LIKTLEGSSYLDINKNTLYISGLGNDLVPLFKIKTYNSKKTHTTLARSHDDEQQSKWRIFPDALTRGRHRPS